MAVPFQTPGELLSYLSGKDIRLSLDSGRLVCNAPKGALTAELREHLALRKPEIIEYLKITAAAVAPPPVARLRRGGAAPLSFGQRRLWYLDQFEPGSAAYNIAAALRLSGELDWEALEAALKEVMRRHEVLRTSLVSTDGSPEAVVGSAADWRIRRQDLQATEEVEQSGMVTRIAMEEAQRPFDLSRGPLLRATLLTLAEREHVLILVVHHIAADGWSLGLFVDELGQIYSAFRQGLPSPLAELELQYRDFAVWQQGWFETGGLRAQMDYWKGRLSGRLPLLDLPADHPRPAAMSFRGTRKKFTLKKSAAAALREFGRSEGITLFMSLLTGFYLLLHRYTRQDDLIVGSAIAGRSRPEWGRLLGLFINNVALRTSLAGDPTVREFVARVRETVLGAFENQDVPFDQVVTALQLERTLNYSPVFQAMLILQNIPIKRLELPGLVMTPVEFDQGTSRFDLTIEAVELDGALRLDVEYSTELFEESTIARMVEHYERLLEGMAADSARRVSQLPMLSESEWAALAAGEGGPALEIPADACIHDLIVRQAARAPDETAVIFGDRTMTYAELDRESNRLAHRLRGLGVGPETLAGVCLQRSADAVVALLGVLKAGGAYVPIDPQYPEERRAFVLEDAGVKVLITDGSAGETTVPPGVTVFSLDENRAAVAGESDLPVNSSVTPDNLAYVIYTSGSTGKPKGVAIMHRSVVNFLESMRREPGMTADDRLVSVTTLSFDIAGLEIYLPLTVGARVVLAPREVVADGLALVRLLRESGATVMQATPATWRLLLESGWNGQVGLKILCGGEALPRELANRLLETGAELWNLYGPTETTIWSVLERVESRRGPVTIGRPIANTQIYLLDERQQPVPPGVPGELWIGGDGLARGYWNRPELTAGRFREVPCAPGRRLYQTGDLVRRRGDGCLEFLGRLDQQIKVRGFRVEVGEIESALERLPIIRQAVVSLREDTPGNPRLVAYVGLNPGEQFDAAGLRAGVRKSLPDYMTPSVFVPLEAFPLTPNGKVDRRALPPPDLPAAPVSRSDPPRTSEEQDLTTVWKELLQRDGFGIHDNFFDLGGHSLLLVKLQSRLRQRFGCELSIVELFERPTVAAMAQALRAGRAAGARSHAN